MGRRHVAGLLALVLVATGCVARPAPSGPAESPQGRSAAPTPPDSPDDARSPESSGVAAAWLRIPLDDGVPVPNLTAIAAFDGGFLVAGQGGAAQGGPVILHSVDGIDWTSEPISSGIRAVPTSLVPIGDGILAIGTAETGRCAHPFAVDTWTRDSGASWTEAPWDERFCAGLSWASALAVRDGIELIGTGSGDQPLAWQSRDGLTWTHPDPVPPDFAARAAVVDGGAVLALGHDGDGTIALRSTVDGRQFAAVPFVPLPQAAFALALIERPDGPIAFIAVDRTVIVIRRDASGSWGSTPAIGLPADQVGTIEAAGDGLIGIGGDESRHALLWSSMDGVAWTPVAAPDPEPGALVSHVAVRSSLAVAIGTVDSPDGLRSIGTIWTGTPELLGLPR